QQPEAFLADAQFFLVLPALCQVAGDLGEAGELARPVVDCRDHDIGPEPGAVLAQAPAFVLETAVLACAAQFLLRPTGRDRLRWIENREVLPDDFLAPVALQFFGTGVP